MQRSRDSCRWKAATARIVMRRNLRRVQDQGSLSPGPRISEPRNGASVVRTVGLVLPVVPTAYPLHLSRSQDSISGRDTTSPRAHAGDKPCFSEHEACQKYVSPPREAAYHRHAGEVPVGSHRSPERWACKGCSCDARYLSGAPTLVVNSLIHHGGLHHRRSVSPSWQYGP
jgi:hypothetical protein